MKAVGILSIGTFVVGSVGGDKQPARDQRRRDGPGTTLDVQARVNRLCGLRMTMRLGVLSLALSVGLAWLSTQALAQSNDEATSPQGTVLEVARSRGAAIAPPPNSTLRTISVGGAERSFWIVQPPSARRPAPVVFVLHGGSTGDARVTFRYRFQDLGARDGVVTVHPNGVGEGWNDGRGTQFLLARGGAADDVAFFRAMIDALALDGTAEPNRIYVTGGSNGGMMTMRLACELGESLAAVAAFSANLPAPLVESCTPSRPVPIMLMNGTADRLMPYAGGAVAAISGDDRGQVIGAEETFQFWSGRNRCNGAPVQQDLPDVDPADETRVRMQTAQNCAASSVLYTIIGGGHRLPGESARVYADQRMARLSGVSSQDIDGRALIWEFLMANRLP